MARNGEWDEQHTNETIFFYFKRNNNNDSGSEKTNRIHIVQFLVNEKILLFFLSTFRLKVSFFFSVFSPVILLFSLLFVIVARSLIRCNCIIQLDIFPYAIRKLWSLTMNLYKKKKIEEENNNHPIECLLLDVIFSLMRTMTLNLPLKWSLKIQKKE